jgi:ankyrin repeat protein
MSQESNQAVVEECVGSAHGNLDRVRELVERYPAVVQGRASWDESPIEAAAQMGRKDIIEYLLDRGAPLDFFTACVLGRRDVVEDELASDPERARARGVHGLPSLYFAAIGGQPAIAELLLAHGARINEGSEAAAPIHGAVIGGRPEMITWLLARGADASLPDYQGRTARELAEAVRKPDLAALLG